jgi:hypothetical protein
MLAPNCRPSLVVSQNYNPKYLLFTTEISGERLLAFKTQILHNILHYKYLDNITKSPKRHLEIPFQMV